MVVEVGSIDCASHWLDNGNITNRNMSSGTNISGDGKIQNCRIGRDFSYENSERWYPAEGTPWTLVVGEKTKYHHVDG